MEVRGDKTRKFTPARALPRQGGRILLLIFSWYEGGRFILINSFIGVVKNGLRR
jgi:hypothetical protein